MNQEEISALDDILLNRLAVVAVRESRNLTRLDETDLNGFIDGDFSPLVSTHNAMTVAAALDMTISFGDSVVLVSEPAGCQSRTVKYDGPELVARVHAMRRAITLLAVDYSQIT